MLFLLLLFNRNLKLGKKIKQYLRKNKKVQNFTNKMAALSVRPTKESLSYKCLRNNEHFVEEKAQTVTVTHSLKTQLAEILHLGFCCTPGNTLHFGSTS